MPNFLAGLFNWEELSTANKINAGKFSNVATVPQIDLTRAAGGRNRISLNGDGYAAFFCAAFYACEMRKAGTIATLPVAVYRKTDEGREKLRNHALTKLLTGYANPLMSSYMFLHWLWLRRDTFGDAYVFVQYDKAGEPCALYPLLSTPTLEFKPSRGQGREVLWRVRGDKYVPDGAYFSHEVIKISTGFTKDGVTGGSLAEYAANAVELSLDLEAFYSSMLHNSNHVNGHVEVDSQHSHQKDLESIRDAIRAKSGIDKAGEAPIFAHGAKWVNDRPSMKDASIIEQQQWITKQVCRVCNVPPFKVYEYDGVNYSNGEAQNINFATDTIAAEVRCLEVALGLILQAMGEPDTFVHFDLDGMARGDMASRANYYQSMRYMGVMSNTEIRKKEDLPPCDVPENYLFPANYGVYEGGELKLVTQGKEPAVSKVNN